MISPSRRLGGINTCLFTGSGGLTHAQSAISNQQSAISNQQSSNHSPPLIIRWITSFIVLAALFFVLPASCDDPNTNGGGGGSTDGGGNGGTMPPPPAVAPGITSGGAYTSVTVTMTSMPGATIYYLAASDTTTDLSTAINPTNMSTYTGTGTTVTPATFSSAGDVYRIKAMAVLADGRRTPETDIQRYDYDYDIDVDDDGLIEIHNLEMFNNIRNNLAGTRYDDGSDSLAGARGCPVAGCNGYELMVNLDFADVSSYASAAVNTTWCPVPSTCIGTTQAGFPGIGPASGDSGGFTGIFEGNGNSISNFYSRNTADTDDANIGLFNRVNGTGIIRNIAVVDANVFGGMAADRIGGLVGDNEGTIIAGSASGSADGGDGIDDFVGGLVGQNTGTIIASYAYR